MKYKCEDCGTCHDPLITDCPPVEFWEDCDDDDNDSDFDHVEYAIEAGGRPLNI